MKSFGSQSAPAPPLLEDDVLVPPELLVDVPASVPPLLLLLEEDEELDVDEVDEEDDLPASGFSVCCEGGSGRLGSVVVVGTA